MSKQQRTFRYWLQQFHLWIGLILLLPLVMMGVTGAVLVYGHDIEHLLGNPRFELLRHDITFPLYVEVDEIGDATRRTGTDDRSCCPTP